MRTAGVWSLAVAPALALMIGGATIGHAADAPQTTSRSAAAPGSPVAPPDEALALVREMSARDPSRNLLGTFRTGMINTLVERSSLTPEQAAQAIDQYFMPIYTEHYGELEPKLAAIWSAHFTPAEIQGLREVAKDPSAERQELFGSTSLGQKYSAEQPEITDQSSIAARDWGRPVTCLAFRLHGPDLVKMGVDPKLVELPAEVCPH